MSNLPNSVQDRFHQSFELNSEQKPAIRTIPDATASTTVSGSVAIEGYIAGKLTLVEINDTTWTAIPVTPLADRHAVSIQNRTGQSLYYNWEASDVDAVYKGWVVPNGYERSWPVQIGAVLYFKSTSGTVKLMVEELKK